MRGYEAFVRALAATCALAFVAQCAESQASTLEPPATTAAADVTAAATTEPMVDTTSVDTSVADTSAPATTSATTIPRTTTTEAPEPTTTTTLAPEIDPNCPLTPHGAVIDRDRQRAWLCENGFALPEFPVTTAINQPAPGTYPVFSKSMKASSRFGGHYSTMTHFVAFTRGIDTGARVAFHTVPVLRNGEFAQTLASVGTQLHRGDSSGCIRVLPEDGPVVWDWLQKGDEVRVIN